MNEGREEKLEELMSENERLRQAYQYIHASRNSVDKELNEAQKENDSLRDQLSKEREMRKELVGYVIAYRGLASLTSDEDIFIGSLIKKASELDKN